MKRVWMAAAFVVAGGLGAFVTSPGSARAAASAPPEKRAPSSPDTEAPAPPTPTASPASVRRDPKGITGISPYMEALAEGRRAAAQGSFAEAAAAFDRAAKKEPDRLVPHLLKGQALLAQGDVEAAREAASPGLNKEGTALERSKLLFLLADLDERKENAPPGRDNQPDMLDKLKAAWSVVKKSWATYVALLDATKVDPEARKTADERTRQADARVARDRDYAAA
ncbi:MAG: tetratricopeptide repeat protein, partial [Myxococcota bacterium]